MLIKDSDTMRLHLKNIYQSGEFEEHTTTEESSVVQREGNRQVNRKRKFYNLDAIISINYRVNSKRGIQFRIWTSRIIKETAIEAYAEMFAGIAPVHMTAQGNGTSTTNGMQSSENIPVGLIPGRVMTAEAFNDCACSSAGLKRNGREYFSY